MPAIQTRDLCKTYLISSREGGIGGALKALFSNKKTAVKAVQNVNLSIDQGEIVGFLGPNGAGKTTTLKMMTGILHPTSGEVSVLDACPTDRNPKLLRQIALVMGNKQQLWWDLPATESFKVLGELYEVPTSEIKTRVDYMAKALQIEDKITQQVRRLSLGERMKCELIAALLHRPRVIFLDEPTLGLDVVSQKRMREFLQELHAQEQCTIILTSHYMQDVEELCKRVIIIDKGTVVFDGQLEDLKERYSDSRKLVLQLSEVMSMEELSTFGNVTSIDNLTVTFLAPKAQISALTANVLDKLPVLDLSVEGTDVEEVIRELFSSSRT